jgi:hypothetical protein
MSKRHGLDELVASYGHETLEDFLGEWGLDSVVPGICPDCGYTTEYEPDQEAGWCEECEANTVVSALVLAGLI